MTIRILIILIPIFNCYDFVASEADCAYSTSEYFGYGCDLQFQDEASSFTEIGGIHQDGKNDDDVLGIWIYEDMKNMDLIPLLCEKFKNVHKLFFQKVRLTELPEKLFDSCKKLEQLTLKSGWYGSPSLTKLPAKLLTQNSKLINFEASSSSLKSLHKNFFANQPNLQRISLRDNSIRSLPSDIFKTSVNLIELILGKNSISHIKPSWFATLGNLKVLYMNDNNIYDIPKNAFSTLINLEELWLSFNYISTIHSDSFAQHANFLEFNLMNNRIRAIDEKFFDNVAVTNLILLSNSCVNKQFLNTTEVKSEIKREAKSCIENYQSRTIEVIEEGNDSESEEISESVLEVTENIESERNAMLELIKLLQENLNHPERFDVT